MTLLQSSCSGSTVVKNLSVAYVGTELLRFGIAVGQQLGQVSVDPDVDAPFFSGPPSETVSYVSSTGVATPAWLAFASSSRS